MWPTQICNAQIEHSDLYRSVVTVSNDDDTKSSGGNTSLNQAVGEIVGK